MSTFSTDGCMPTLFTVRMIRSVQYMQVFDVSSCLLFFHVCLLKSWYCSRGTLSTLSSRSGYCILLHHRQKIDVLCLLLRLSTF